MQTTLVRKPILREVVQAGADLSLLDEQGYSALDWAVFVNDAQAESILVQGLRTQFRAQFGGTDEDAKERVRVLQEAAHLRKGYRELFQEKLRPVLMERGPNCLQRLRQAYAEALDKDPDKERMFDRLKYVSCEEFRTWGRLRRSCGGLTRPYSPEVMWEDEKEREGKYIIFFSYRWINKDPGMRSPDDEHNTQYKRMSDAVRLFLERHPEVASERLCIWMVSFLFFFLPCFPPVRR